MTNDEGMPKQELTDYPLGKRCLPLAIKALAMAICMSAVSARPAEHMDSTPQEVFDSMRESFQASKAKGVHARYQWDLSGPQGGQWWIDVDDGKYKMGKGKIDNPTVTFITSDKDWVAMSNGTLKGTWAYMTGRLKVRGPQSVARKLNEIFP
jgi:putative sterol carrier protein